MLPHGSWRIDDFRMNPTASQEARMSFSPTVEQQHALELFATGESLAIEAGAGTGKTSTLKLLAESAPNRRGQYVAFNRAIVAEAGQKMPGTVNASTAHSLAMRAVGHEYRDRLDRSRRMRSLDIANMLRIDPMKVKTFDGEDKLLSQSFLAGITMKAVTRFCQSADLEPTMWHVPYIEGLDPTAKDDHGHRRNVVNKQVAKYLEKFVKLAWSDLMDHEGGLPFAHDHYLKAWHLSDPKIGADYILFDEAQDANPVMVAIVAAQEAHAQLVWVGDSQQQIYSFTGAVNALSTVPASNKTFLTQSFRFGQPIAEVANVVLNELPDAELRIFGTPSISSVVGPVAEPDAILTRTNAAAIREVLGAQQRNLRPHLVGGGDEVVKFAKAAKDLQEGRTTEHVDLACFDTWNDVVAYVSEDEQGSELRLMVKLVEDFGVQTILDALDRHIDEKDADLIISTAHKSKGREWDSVRLAGDFPETPQGEELRLLYVAVTRAKRALDIDAVPFVANLVPESLRVGGAPVATTAAQATESHSHGPAEPVKPKVHLGTVGQSIALTATAVRVVPMTTKFGPTNLTTFEDADGNVVKAFIKEELTEGVVYVIDAKVKEHGEFKGVKETTVNYVTARQAVTA